MNRFNHPYHLIIHREARMIRVKRCQQRPISYTGLNNMTRIFDWQILLTNFSLLHEEQVDQRTDQSGHNSCIFLISHIKLSCQQGRKRHSKQLALASTSYSTSIFDSWWRTLPAIFEDLQRHAKGLVEKPTHDLPYMPMPLEILNRLV
jgi:hypothetical protein